MSRRRWMVCDVTERGQTRCLFDEETTLPLGEEFRCIRHGALVWGAAELDGLSRDSDAMKAYLVKELK